MANAGKGHLFGDALFNADFFQLQNTEGEEIIKYTKEGGLEIPGGGGSGDAYIEISGKTPQQVVDACISTVESGGTPWLVGVFGMIYKLDTYNPDDGVLIFSHNEIEVGGGAITYFGLKALAYYKEEGTWTVEAGTKNIIV